MLSITLIITAPILVLASSASFNIDCLIIQQIYRLSR